MDHRCEESLRLGRKRIMYKTRTINGQNNQKEAKSLLILYAYRMLSPVRGEPLRKRWVLAGVCRGEQPSQLR